MTMRRIIRQRRLTAKEAAKYARLLRGLPTNYPS